MEMESDRLFVPSISYKLNDFSEQIQVKNHHQDAASNPTFVANIPVSFLQRFSGFGAAKGLKKQARAPAYIEGFQSLGVHALCVVDLVAVIVVVVVVVVVVDDLRPAGGQVLGAHSHFGFHRVVAP